MVKYKVLYIVISLLVIILLLAVCMHIFSKNENTLITPTGSHVTENIFINDVRKITDKYGLVTENRISIIKNEDSYYKFYEGGTLGKGYVVEIITSNTLFADKKRYIEIEALMDLWLYIVEHSFEFEITGISFSYQEIYDIMPPFYKTLLPNVINISKEDFIYLYEKLDLSKQNREEAIKILSEVFVKQTGYVRNNGYVNPTYY